MSRLEHLKKSLAHAEAALDGLDLSETVCACCEVRRYNNFSEMQTGKKLEGICHRLESMIAQMEHGAPVKGRGDFHAEGD